MSPRALRLCWLLVAVLWVVAEVCAALGFGSPPHRTFLGPTTLPFLTCAFAGTFAFWLALGGLGAKWTRVAWAAALFALVVAAGAPLASPGPIRPMASVFLVSRALALLGWVGALGLVVASFRGEPEARRRARRALGLALLLPTFIALNGFFLPLTAALHPRVLDGFALAFDRGLGVAPSVALTRWFARLPWLAALCALVYQALPLGFVALMAKALSERDEEAAPLLGFLLVGALGYGLYQLFPVIGPVEWLASAWPSRPPALGSALRPFSVSSLAPRNCVPSLHTAWALLAFFCARRWGPRWRWMLGTMGVLTVLATLGLGFHYFADLVVAVPFTLAVLTACEPAAIRRTVRARRILISSAGAVVAWLLALRLGAPLWLASPVLGWSATGLTVIGCGLAERRLWLLRGAAAAQPEVGWAPEPQR
jgi:hypothetical protein